MPKHATPIKHANGFTINGCTFHVDPKYEPIDAIGKGSYGVVCSVLNTLTKEKVAIKKITPMAEDEWDATHTLREIRLMRCLGEHENIISLKDLTMCVEKDELYMMMELADTDLHRLIQSACPLTEGHIRFIMYQLLSGVKAMHDNGVLHRDLKPGNLLINKDCRLKITDFGLARMVPKELQQKGADTLDSSAASPMTEYVVTRWYRPPELMLAPNGVYDGAVDMWSVGCILGELVARKPLFPGSDFMDQLTRVFEVIAIPPKNKLGYTIEKDALKFLASLPPTPPNALDKLCKAKNFSPETKDLMERLLCFNPKERITVDEALRHPFFKGIDDEWGAIQPLKLAHSLEFAFEDQSLPLNTLRQYIKDEVAAFQAKAAAVMSPEDTPDSGFVPAQPQSDASPTANNPISLTSADGDYAPGLGFVIKGCEFNVPPKYKAINVLGEGSYGVVCSASDTEENQMVAIKKITPMAGDEWDAKHTLREIRLMRYFDDHPNIASLQNLSTCTAKDELYIMMDLVDIDLHRLIQSKTKLEENHIAVIMYQLLCGAKALHENGVLHRDLKPGNILISKNCDVKITDFGLSRFVPNGRTCSQTEHPLDKEAPQLMTEYVVTRWYRPPEIMLAPNGTYAEAVDMWSIGCIFAELLNRKPLFPGTDFIDQLTRVFTLLPVPPKEKRGYNVEGDALKFLDSLPRCSPQALTKAFRKASPEAISLLRRLLCINPQRRITADQALQHPYFKTVRAQLGEPLAFQVSKSFDFEFDHTDLSLSKLRQLIQDEVRLFSKGAPPQASPQVAKEDEVQPPVTTTTEEADVEYVSKPTVKSNHDSLCAGPRGIDKVNNEAHEQPQSIKSVESVPETTSRSPDTEVEKTWVEDAKEQQMQHDIHDALDNMKVSVEPADSDDDGDIIVEGEEKKTSLDSQPTEWEADDDDHDELLEAIQKLNQQAADQRHAIVRPPSNQDQLKEDMDEEVFVEQDCETARTSSRPLPPGWEERVNKKYNRIYYVDLVTKTSTWEHPADLAERKSTTSTKPSQPLPHHPTQQQNHPPLKKSSVLLPKDWERRTDSKTGRLYYVNLLTKKTFARLPSSISASMVQKHKPEKQQPQHHDSHKENMVKKRQVTVPQSPQFSQMSWQRKQRANSISQD